MAEEAETGVLSVVEYAIVIDHKVTLTVPGSYGLRPALDVFERICGTERDGNGVVNLVARPDLSGQRPGILLGQHSWGDGA